MATPYNAYFQEEEDINRYFQDVDNIDKYFQDTDNIDRYFDEEALSTTQPAGGMSSIEASVPLAKQRQGKGAEQTLKNISYITGLNTDDAQSFFSNMEQEGVKGIQEWRPKELGTPFLQSRDKPTWVAEQLGSQAAETGFIYGISLISKYLPGPLGTLTRLGTVGTTYNSIYAELMDDVARKSNKSPEELTEEDKRQIALDAGLGTALELVVPFRAFKKGPKLTGKNQKKDLKSLEDWLKKTDKQGKIKQAGEFAKSTAKIGTGEAITETGQGLLSSARSDAGLAYEFTPEGQMEAVDRIVGGFAGGGVFGAPASVSAARSQNVMRKDVNTILEQANVDELMTAANQYQQELNRGPVQENFDVTPHRYETLGEEDTYLGGMADLVKGKLFGKSVNEFRDLLKNARTGKDAFVIRNELYGAFGQVESGSGQQQGGQSFDAIKNNLTGKYSKQFEKIKDKWSKGTILTGEQLYRVDPAIDAYVRAKLTNGDIASASRAVKKVLNTRQVKDLDKDIVKLRKIQDGMYNELKTVLKDSNLDIGYTKDYISRGINRRAVKNNPEKFKESLRRDLGYNPYEAEEIYQSIVEGRDPNVLTSEQIRSGKIPREGRGRAGFEKERSERWERLDPEFRDNSAFASIENYLINASNRAASAKAFGGNRAEKLTRSIQYLQNRGLISDEQVQTVWDMYDAEHHLYKKPKTRADRAWQQTSRALSNLAAIKLLGLATLSSLPELAWMPTRVGFINMVKAAPSAANYMIRGILNSVYGGTKVGKEVKRAFAKDVIQTMGMALNPSVSERVEMLMVGDVNPFMNLWFRSPGGMFLTQYTNFVRAWTAVAGLKMINTEAKRIDKVKGRHRQALVNELKENGLTIEDFKTMYRLGNNKIDFTNDEYLDTRFTKSDGTQVSVRDVLVPWVRKITTDVALEPRPHNRPLWMANPNLQMIAQLKSFPVLFANTILKRSYNRLNPKVCSPNLVGNMNVLGGIAAALATATMVVALKKAIKGNTDAITPIDVLGGVGIPYVGTESLGQAASIPALAVPDAFLRALFGGDDFGDTAENILQLILRVFPGSLFAEAIK